MRSEVITHIIARRKGKSLFTYSELRLANVFISISKETGSDVPRSTLPDNDQC